MEGLSDDDVQNPDNLIFSRDEDDIVNFIEEDRVIFGNTDDEEEEVFRGIGEAEGFGSEMEEASNEIENDETEMEIKEPFQEYTGVLNISRTARNRVHPFLLGSNNGTKLRMIISELQVMIDESRLELDDLKMEYKTTKRSLLEEQARNLHLENQIEQLKDIEDFKNTNRIEDLRGEKLDQSEKELELLKERNEELIKERNQIEKKYLTILKHKKFTIKSSEGEIVRLTTQLTEANTLLETRMMKIEQLKEKITDIEKNHRRSLENISEEVKKKNIQISKLGNLNRNLGKEKERYDRIQQTNNRMLGELNVLKNENTKLINENHSKQMHISELESQINEIGDTNNQSMSSNKYFYEREITKLKEELVTEKTEKESLKHSLRRYKNELKKKDQHSKQQQFTEIESLQAEVRKLEKKNKILEERNGEKLNDSIINLRNEQKKHIQNICKKLLIEKKEIHQEIQKAKIQLGKEKKKYKKVSGQLNESKKIIKSLEETVKLEESKSSSILLELNQEKEKSISVESRFLNQSQMKNEELNKSISSLKNRNERLKRDLEDIRNERNNFHVKHVENMKVIVEKYNKQKEWIRRARQKEESHQSKIQFLEIEFNRLSKTVFLKDKQLKHLQNVLNMMKEEVAISKAK